MFLFVFFVFTIIFSLSALILHIKTRGMNDIFVSVLQDKRPSLIYVILETFNAERHKMLKSIKQYFIISQTFSYTSTVRGQSHML